VQVTSEASKEYTPLTGSLARHVLLTLLQPAYAAALILGKDPPPSSKFATGLSQRQTRESGARFYKGGNLWRVASKKGLDDDRIYINENFDEDVYIDASSSNMDFPLI
jgi:hypothetical protein